MNLIEKENFACFERREDGRQVALALEQRAGTGLDVDAQLVGDDLRQRSLAQSRRAVEQHVIERFAAAARGLDGDLDVFFHALLADEIGHALRAHAGVEPRVFVKRPAGDDALWRLICSGWSSFHHASLGPSLPPRSSLSSFCHSERSEESLMRARRMRDSSSSRQGRDANDALRSSE